MTAISSKLPSNKEMGNLRDHKERNDEEIKCYCKNAATTRKGWERRTGSNQTGEQDKEDIQDEIYIF